MKDLNKQTIKLKPDLVLNLEILILVKHGKLDRVNPQFLLLELELFALGINRLLLSFKCITMAETIYSTGCKLKWFWINHSY